MFVYGAYTSMRVCFCTYREEEEEISAAASQLTSLNNRNRID